MHLQKSVADKLTQRRIRRTGAAVIDSGIFDATWYMETYTDVAETSIDPLIHFVKYGFNEGRDPGPNFSLSGYRWLNQSMVGSARPVAVAPTI